MLELIDKEKEVNKELLKKILEHRERLNNYANNRSVIDSLRQDSVLPRVEEEVITSNNPEVEEKNKEMFRRLREMYK